MRKAEAAVAALRAGEDMGAQPLLPARNVQSRTSGAAGPVEVLLSLAKGLAGMKPVIF